MRFWKSDFAKSEAVAAYRPVWQSGHWDRQMRSLKDYDEKWEYVFANPVRAGLVEQANDWPYQGVVEPIQFVDMS